MTRIFALVAVILAAAALAYSDEQPAEKTTAETTTADKDKKDDTKNDKSEKSAKEEEDPEKVDWKKVDWRKRLTRFQYEVMRNADTERPFTNKYWKFFNPGEYHCAACGLALFEGDAKFQSECGWPSFDQTINKKAVTEHKDHLLGYERIEIRCRRCGSHLGHVFNDGPTDTGLRYCLNSVAMKFIPERELKEKRAAEKTPATEKKEKTDDDKEKPDNDEKEKPAAAEAK